jgi:Enoyl-CoA hydratase/isomerase
MGPKLVDYLLYEPEDNGILLIKFNRPERLNALVGTAEENGTVAKVGEYMRADDDDPNIRVIVLTGVGRAFCSGANLGANKADAGENFPGKPTHARHPSGDRRRFGRLRHGHPSVGGSIEHRSPGGSRPGLGAGTDTGRPPRHLLRQRFDKPVLFLEKPKVWTGTRSCRISGALKPTSTTPTGFMARKVPSQSAACRWTRWDDFTLSVTKVWNELDYPLQPSRP